MDKQAIFSLLSIFWTIYVACVAVWIILQKRAPVSTICWVLSMALLPMLGFVIYYFFGPRRLERQRFKRSRSHRKLFIKEDKAKIIETSGVIPSTLKQISQLGFASCQIPLSTAKKIELLTSGAATFESIFAAIDRATHHIHLEYYIFESDTIGTALRDKLIACAKRGVKVRLLVDALGSKKTKRDFFQPLCDAGGEFVFFHNVRIGRRLRPVTNFRTHRKILICDGVVGFSGGVNITDQEDIRVHQHAYQDMHLRLEGNVVRWLQTVFLEDWIYAKRTNDVFLTEDYIAYFPPSEPGIHPVQIVTSGPDNWFEPIHRIYVAVIDAAVDRIWLTTPYFVPSSAALMALTSAALRGVDVRLLIPQRSDSRLVSAAARSYYDELINAGVKVWSYQAGMLHSKTLVIDSLIGVIGTANFDNRSFQLNFEVCTLVYGTELCIPLARQFENDMLKASRVLKNRKQSFTSRLGDAIARLFSPLL